MGGQDTKSSILKRHFGYSSFRPGQEELIDQILNGQDVLGVMPTGAGKSICYQLPAMLLPGVTLVISPLISLMHDQVSALCDAGIPAAYLNSSLTPAQFRQTLDRAHASAYKLLYVAPERLLTDAFMDFARECVPSMIAVDEAHCVSQWGQDFRPGYLNIQEFIQSLPNRPVVTAFTATATETVRQDIISLLQLHDPFVQVSGFDRQNLFFSVQKPIEKFAALKKYLTQNPGKSGIVYCLTRKLVEEVGERLERCGFAVARYHAGLPDEERRRAQEDFVYDRKPVMVATNAFGMGIDKSNVSFVIHYNMPKDIESYYQEAGRAGRDGMPADCILLYGGKDVVTHQFMIDHADENEALDFALRASVREKDRARLREMTFYCHTNDCLRGYILRYFGERSPGFCGNCSSCKQHFEQTDITIEAQKILSCVKRMRERFGVKMVCDVLRGSKNERLLRLHLNHLPTYGVMADSSEHRLREMINFLILEGYLRQTDDEYPVLTLTQKSPEVLFHGQVLSMKMAKEKESRRAEKQNDLPAEVNSTLFARLKSLRSKLATEQKVPAYIVFTDASLKDMASKRPQNEEEFLNVSGIGAQKCRKYGKVFMDEIKKYWMEQATTDHPEAAHPSSDIVEYKKESLNAFKERMYHLK